MNAKHFFMIEIFPDGYSDGNKKLRSDTLIW